MAMQHLLLDEQASERLFQLLYLMQQSRAPIACCLCACLWSAQHRGAICSVCQHSSAKLLALDHTLLTQQHIQVSGIGKYPFLALERADLQFGNVLVGEQVEQTVRLLNQGLLPADFTVIPIQPPSGSPVESCIKISPTRSGSLR